VELSDLNKSEQEQHAFFLGLAALLGEGVYNLGELVSRKGMRDRKQQV
jgi:26S proteasome regulatory subunit N9